MPMFVGLVRGAIAGTGRSWKLSGGSQFYYLITNVAK
jgi:hypothetical protein